MTIYDLIIIGAGPAGITAAVYAARKQMSLLVITEDIGGQAAWSGDIENYTGYQFISGPELSAQFELHMRTYDIPVKSYEPVSSLAKVGDIITVTTDQSGYQARTVIVASGKRPRPLDVPGEAAFKNKGLTYCATCDGPLFRGKKIAIIGGGNSALDAVLQMIKIAEQVTVITIDDALRGDEIMREKIMSADNVDIITNAKVQEIAGDDLVSSVRVTVGDNEHMIPVEGVFVEIGLIPNSQFCDMLTKNDVCEILIDHHNQTNVPGIFAAGDVTDVPEKQIIIAAGEGSKACLSAFRYLSTKKF